MKQLSIFGLAIAIASCTFGCTASPANTTTATDHDDRPPNFVFILVDDLGWMDVGFNGSSFYETPHLDALAARGVVFSNAYAACPVCSPTRASIMTGRYPARIDTTDWFGAPQPDTTSKHWLTKPLLPAPYIDRLPHDELTLAEALKENGYATFFAGKWHLGPEGWWPEDHGFDVNKGGWRSGGPYGPGKYFTPYGNPRLDDGPEGEHLPDRLARETASFIAEHKDSPFLAYLSFYSVHTPLIARDDLTTKYRNKKKSLPESELWGTEGERKVRLVQEHAVYAGMVEAMDQAVGTVVAELDELALTDNTVIIFTSDNGGLSTSEGHPTSNLPLRAGKGWLYEGGIREPTFIVWPGRAAAGRVCDEPVISTDFYPTILDIAHLELLPEQHVDGVSLVPLLTQDDTLARDAIYWHYPHYGNQGASPGSAVRAGPWKLIEWFEDGRLELYRLDRDIGEQHDRSADEPDKTQMLHDRLKKWRSSVDAKLPTANATQNADKNDERNAGNPER